MINPNEPASKKLKGKTKDMKIYLSSKGIRPDIDNAQIINRVLETAKPGSTIVFKDGAYPIGSTLEQSNRLHWEGAEDTALVCNKPMTAANFTGQGNMITISRIHFEGFYSIWDNSEMKPFHGVTVEAVLHMKDCIIHNFWGTGLVVSADVGTRKTNASFSRFDNLLIYENREHGIYLQGGDANQCGFYHCDARDNKGIGFYDHSFLGNQFYGCMSHNNWNGSYKADDLNNRAGFFGCYAEMGSGPIYLGGNAQWYGGLPSDGFELHENAKVWYYGNEK